MEAEPMPSTLTLWSSMQVQAASHVPRASLTRNRNARPPFVAHLLKVIWCFAVSFAMLLLSL